MIFCRRVSAWVFRVVWFGRQGMVHGAIRRCIVLRYRSISIPWWRTRSAGWRTRKTFPYHRRIRVKFMSFFGIVCICAVSRHGGCDVSFFGGRVLTAEDEESDEAADESKTCQAADDPSDYRTDRGRVVIAVSDSIVIISTGWARDSSTG